MHSRVSLARILPLIMLLGVAAAHAQGREEARLLTSMQVLQELRATPDQWVPGRLLERAYGIAIIPDVTKAAFFFGGERGNGVLVVRDKEGRFSDPVFVNLTGGSFGFQFGVQSTDVVLVFTTPSGVKKITGGKLTLGADASVAAGPVGRQASVATDPTFSSEVYSYSRSRGLFGGIALVGAAVTIDKGANGRFYDKGTASAADIVSGAITTDSEVAHRFLAAVGRATGTSVASAAATVPNAPAAPNAAAPAPGTESAPAGPAAGTGAAPPATPSGAAAPQASAPGSEAQTFPMQDPNPGREPH